MPEQKTLKRAQADKRAGKASSTQAGEFVKEQVDKVRAGKHGVQVGETGDRDRFVGSAPRGRRREVAEEGRRASEATRKKAESDNAAGQHKSTAKKSASRVDRARNRQRSAHAPRPMR